MHPTSAAGTRSRGAGLVFFPRMSRGDMCLSHARVFLAFTCSRLLYPVCVHLGCGVVAERWAERCSRSFAGVGVELLSRARVSFVPRASASAVVSPRSGGRDFLAHVACSYSVLQSRARVLR